MIGYRQTPKTTLIFTLVLGLALVWYLFIKNFDYLYTFSSNAAPGTIYQQVLDWSQIPILGIDSSFIAHRDPFEQVEQIVTINGTMYSLTWQMKRETDSLTKINVGVNALGVANMNRLTLLLGTSEVKDKTVGFVRTFREYSNNSNSRTKLEPEILFDDIPQLFCACVTSEGRVQTKAQKMMSNNALLIGFLKENNILLNGKPFVEVLQWNLADQKINFDFCFPVTRPEKLPEHEIIKFKEVKQRKAIKATYFGNYRTSEMAWYLLYDFAQRRQLTVELTPFEIFHNNPMADGSDINWKAEILMPLSY